MKIISQNQEQIKKVGKEFLSNFILLWEEKKIVFITAFLGLLVLILILVIMPKNEKTIVKDQNKVQLNDEIYLPTLPSFPDEYIVERDLKHNWSSEEVDKWFTIPDDDMMKDLRDTNNRLSEKILEAVP